MSNVPSPPRTAGVFSWTCLGVAVVALTVFGWMLNDMRLKVTNLVPKVEKVVDVADKRLPPILDKSERVADQLDRNLPNILENADNATAKLSEVADNFKQFKDLMATVHGANPDKSLLAYGTSVLSFLGKQQQAKIGVKKPGENEPLRNAVPAKQWADAASKDAQVLSVVSKNKGEVLNGLAKAQSLMPLYIQVRDRAPQLLTQFLKAAHDESKDIE